MRPRLNPIMAEAQTKLHFNTNKGLIRDSLAGAQAEREAYIEQLMVEELSGQQNAQESAERQAQMDAYMQAAKARVDAQREEMAEARQAAEPVENDLLNLLGTSPGTPD